MRTQLQLRVLIGLIILAFGIVGGLGPVFAQNPGVPAASEVENLKKQMALMEEQLRQLRLQVDKMAGQPVAPGSAGPPAASTADPALEKRLGEVENKADAALTVLGLAAPFGRRMVLVVPS